MNKNTLSPASGEGYSPPLMEIPANEIRFSPEADAALKEFYGKFGENQNVQHKLRIMQEQMGESSFYATGGNVAPEMMLACFEYEWLGSKGLIELDLA